MVLAIGAIVIYALVWKLADYSPQPALKLAESTPLIVGKPLLLSAVVAFIADLLAGLGLQQL